MDYKIRRNLKKLTAWTLAGAMVVAGTAIPSNSALAKQKTVSLAKKKVTVAVGKKKKVTIKNLKSGSKVKVTVKKKAVATVKRKGKKLIITGKKAGNTKAVVKVTYKVNGKTYTKKLKLKVKVKDSASSTATATASTSAVTSTGSATTAAPTQTTAAPTQTTASSGTTSSPSTAAPSIADVTDAPRTTLAPDETAEPVTDYSGSGFSTPGEIEVTTTDLQTEPSDSAIQVTLNGAADITDADGNVVGSVSKNNKVEINEPGEYVITQTDTSTPVEKQIEINLKESTNAGEVHIYLNGVNYSVATDGDEGLIYAKKADNLTKLIITAVDGTTNILEDTGSTGLVYYDSDGNEIEDETEYESAASTEVTYPAGIFAKKTPLTINGTGTITILTANGYGIKCSDESEGLKILDAVVNIGSDDAPAGHTGISSKIQVYTDDADLNIFSYGDGIKTTVDSDDTDLIGAGLIEVEDGEIYIKAINGDAISSSYSVTSGSEETAYGYVLLNPESMTLITEVDTSRYGTVSSEDDLDSVKGVKAGETIYIPSTSGTISIDTTATDVKVGSYSNSDDGLHSNGNIKIAGGTFRIAAADDGIHADSGLNIAEATVVVSEAYEGIEGADITFESGNIYVVATDDGVNAAGGSDSQSSEGGNWFRPGETTTSDTTFQLIINGGTLVIDSEGDGLDSNGNMYINGGDITVYGPSNGGNGALDIGDNGCTLQVNSGTLRAMAGTADMVVTPSGGNQTFLNASFNSAVSKDSTITVSDSSGNVIDTFTAGKSTKSLVYSNASLVSGQSYTVSSGNTSVTVTAGTSSSGGFGPGNQGGGNFRF